MLVVEVVLTKIFVIRIVEKVQNIRFVIFQLPPCFNVHLNRQGDKLGTASTCCLYTEDGLMILIQGQQDTSEIESCFEAIGIIEIIKNINVASYF